MTAARILLLAAAIASAPAAATCQTKEYTEYRDMARQAAGQMTIADGYCRALRQQRTAVEVSDLAMRAGRFGESDRALQDSQACLGEMSKMSNALKAAKANTALAKIVNTCGPNAAPAPSPAQ